MKHRRDRHLAAYWGALTVLSGFACLVVGWLAYMRAQELHASARLLLQRALEACP